MKKLFLLYSLVAITTTALAQVGKLPYLQLEYQPVPNKMVVAAKTTKVTQITLKPTRKNKLDTASIFSIQYLPNGFMHQSDYCDYDSVRGSSTADSGPYKGVTITQKAINCTRITYAYDDKGNLTDIKAYDIMPANSVEAMEYMSDEYFTEKRFAHKNKDGYMVAGEVVEGDMDTLVGIMRRQGIPEAAKLAKETIYTYDGNNNVVHSRLRTGHFYGKESEDDDNRDYTYEFDNDGRVAVSRQSFRYSTSGQQKMTSEIHITYNSNGLPATITNYLAQAGNSNIAAEANRGSKTEITYDSKRKRIKIITWEANKVWKRVETMTYKDTLVASQLKQDVNIPSGKTDTTSYITFTYGKKMNVVTKRRYRSNAVYAIDREELDIDARGLQTEYRSYTRNPQSTQPEKLMSTVVNVYK